jgi:DNA-binding IclR family transcriptional regulator
VLRAGAILRILSQAHGEPVTAAALAATAGMPRSSAVNICVALCEIGMAVESGRGFQLGPGLVELSQAYLSSVDPVRQFSECCRKHVPPLEETVQIAMLDGLEVVYLGRHDGRHPIQIASQVGRRLPATCTALGKAMLASLDDDALGRRLAGAEPLPAMTRRSKTAVTELRRDLDTIRKRGHAIDDEETTEGIYCVATLVPGLPAELGRFAISASILKSRANRTRVSELADTLQRLATAIASPKGA